MTASWFTRLDPVHHTHGRVRFRYRGPGCFPQEARRIEDTVRLLHGVESVRVNNRIRSLVVEFDPAVNNAEELAAAIRALPPPAGSSNCAAGVSGLGTVVLSAATLVASGSLPPALQAPAALGTAIPLLGEALNDFRNKGITSHVLEALAVAISVARRDFLAAHTTSFLLALGEYLEHSIEQRSDDLLKHLLQPATTTVWIERDGQEVEIDAATVAIGDVVIAATGTVIPIDGTVLGGEALINEATMTGESVPVTKGRGKQVLSGTVIEEGRLRIYAERVGRNAAAARIADFVAQSLSARSRTQLEASHLADRLVPMVLGLAGATWLVSSDWQRVAAVLQADYSCALKLATPVAFKSAMYRAGKAGMLVKGASALERLAEADTFVFDKTGTLTTGALRVTDSIAFDSAYTPDDLICLAASVEEHYFHPLAQAVVEAARRIDPHQHFDHKEVEFIVAHGVASIVNGKRIVVGSRHFVEDDEGIDLSAHQAVIERLQGEGKTLLHIGFGGEALGILALQDTLRDNSATTIARLRRLGAKSIHMLTGDRHDRAEELARQLGLDEFHAELLPEQKAAVLQDLAKRGARIVFIGDGVNDAPALTGAHVGIAMHRGADIARLASDILLLEDNIERVADAKAKANANRRLIDSNFKLTVGLNTAILGAAAFGLLTPVSASMLHNGSTIGILLRALLGGARQRSAKPAKAASKRGV